MAIITLTQTTKNVLASELNNLLGTVISPTKNFIISTDMGVDGSKVDQIFRAKNEGDAPDPAGRTKLKDITSYLFIENVDANNPANDKDKLFFPRRSLGYWVSNTSTVYIMNEIGNVDKPELLIPYGSEKQFRDIAFVKSFLQGAGNTWYTYYKIVMFYRYRTNLTSVGEKGVVFVKNFSVTF